MTTGKTAAKTTRKVAARPSPVKKKVAPRPSVGQTAPEKAAQKAKKIRKAHKPKVVRDSFTMPQDEYRQIGLIKKAMQVKKSEVLRAGLKLLAGLGAAQQKRVLAGLVKIKTGRPKKHQEN